MVTTTTDNYFWMVDRLKIEDDTRNKVNMAKNTVGLSKPFIKRLENGFYIGQLLQEIHPTYMNRSGKQFELPQALTEIDPESQPFHKATWRIIFETLASFGLNLPKQKQDIIISTTATPSLIDITDALYDIDNSPQGLVSAPTKRKLDITVTKRSPSKRPTDRLNSAVNGSDNEKLSISDNRREFSVRGSSNIKLRPILGSERGSIVSPSPLKKKRSPSLRSLQKSPDRLQNSIILGKEAQLAFDSEHIEEALPQTLETSRTSVQFMLTSLVIGFDMKPKQAAALLANNHKYLTQLCIKGAKGTGYSSVVKWYNLIYPKAGYLINLINTEKKDILSFGSQVAISSKGGDQKVNRGKILYKTFNILKSGFYSKNSDVQMSCGMLFIQLIKEINHTESDIIGDAWDWFTTSTLQPEFKRAATGGRQDQALHFSKHRGSKAGGDDEIGSGLNNEFDELQFQTGLQAVAHAYETNVSFLSIGVELYLNFGVANPLELFTQKMQNQLKSWSSYGTISNDIFQVSKDMELADRVLMQSGVVRYWLTNSLKVAESQNELPLNDRIVSLVFMTSIWLTKPQFVENNVNGATDAILRILKKAARDVKTTLTLISIELLFRLLEKFASEKHKVAPTIYKTLTFLLVEFYWETETREYMLKHFIELFNNVESIPLQILCEPLLKQIEISQYNAASFNVFDFEFFTRLAQHKKLNIQTGVILIESLSKIALTSVFYEKPALLIVQSLMQRFGSYQELFEHWQHSIHEILQTLINIQARIAIHRHHVKNEENNFFNRLALRKRQGKEYQIDPSGGRMSDAEYQTVRINEKLIVNLIQQVIYVENQLVNNDIRNQLIDTHLGIQTGLKVECKATRYLISLFTPKVDQIIEQRIAANPNSLNQVPIPYIQELEQIQMDAAQGSLVNPGAVDIYASKRGNTLRKQISQRSISPENNPLKILQSPVVAGVKAPFSAADNRKEQATKQYLYEYKKWEEDWEIRQYQNHLKRHSRMYRELHKHYLHEAVKKPHAVDRSTFADNEKSNDQISAQGVLKMIKDFKLENGVQHNYLKLEVNKLVKFVNIYIMNEKGSIELLTFDGFQNFMLQYAYQLFGHEENVKSYVLIDKLINRMKEHPNFQKLGLVINNNEATPKTNQLMQQIGEKVLSQAGVVPQQFKKVDDKQQIISYAVPQCVGNQFIPEKTKIAIELLDEIYFNAIGGHILEPTVTEKVITKIVPQIVSVRSPLPRNMIVSPIRGLQANQPLSQKNPLSAEQEIRQQEYQRAKEQTEMARRQTTNSNPAISKLLFKAQAINRRAKQFGDEIQQAIIQADPADKQNMFEAAEVLHEILNAVEQGKKALRLDFTPYKLYEKRKRPEQRSATPIQEVKEPIDHEERQRRKNAQANILKQVSNVLQKQEILRHQELSKQEEETRKHELKKQRIREEYQMQIDHLKAERQQPPKEVAKQKKQEQLQKEKQEREVEERKLQAKEKTRKYKQELRQNQKEKQNMKLEEEQLQNEKKEWEADFKERMVQKSQMRAEQLQKERFKNQEVFYTWAASKPIQEIVNLKMKKGLTILYQQVEKMGKSTTGITQEAWMEFLRQRDVIRFLDVKALHRAFAAQLKELDGDVPYQRLAQIFKTDVKGLSEKPGDGMINYGGFVAGLIKVANLRNYLEKNGKHFKSQNKISDLSEFTPVDQTGTAFSEFLQFLGVAEKKV